MGSVINRIMGVLIYGMVLKVVYWVAYSLFFISTRTSMNRFAELVPYE